MSLEIPNLDDMTFEELFLEARTLIARWAPRWTDHNFSDPGMTFIDLFAWLAEMQAYSANRVTPAHKRKFLRLLGMSPSPARPSFAHVRLTLKGGADRPIRVPAGALLFAEDGLTGLSEPFETAMDVTVSAASIGCVAYVRDNKCRVVPEKIDSENGYFEPFSASAPAKGRMLIGFEKTGGSCAECPLNLKFRLIENDLPSCGASRAECPSVRLRWEKWTGNAWRPLDVKDGTRGFMQSGYVVLDRLEGAKESKLRELPGFTHAPEAGEPPDGLAWISITPCGSPGERYEIAPRIHAIRIHATPVIHGRTWSDECCEGTSMPLQSLSLKHAPVIAGSVKILVDGKKWTEVHDFDGSGPGDTHFTVDCESATVRFGDGEHGAIPPFPREEKKKEKNIVVKTYRSGGGIRGNIPVHYKIKRYALHRFFDPKYEPVKIAGFTRPVGGAEAETVDAALDRGRRERKSATRLIGEGDIGELARQTPGTRIHSLRVLFDYHPLFASIAMPGAITVAVVPFTRDVEMVPPVGPSRGFLARIKRFLDDKRIIASDLRVVGPVYVPVSVDALLRIRPHFDAEAIKAAAEKAVGDFINPFSGGPDRKGWEFGRSVFAAEITALLQRIEGVACVETPEVKEWKEDAPGAADKSRSESVALPKTGLPYAWFSRGPDIPARSSITIRIAGE